MDDNCVSSEKYDIPLLTHLPMKDQDPIEPTDRPVMAKTDVNVVVVNM